MVAGYLTLCILLLLACSLLAIYYRLFKMYEDLYNHNVKTTETLAETCRRWEEFYYGESPTISIEDKWKGKQN